MNNNAVRPQTALKNTKTNAATSAPTSELASLEQGASLWVDAWARLRQNRLAVICLGIFIAICLFCLLGPWLSPYDSRTQDLFAGAQAPSLAHPFGTDSLGRDLMVRTMEGGRIAIAVGSDNAEAVIIVDAKTGQELGRIMLTPMSGFAARE